MDKHFRIKTWASMLPSSLRSVGLAAMLLSSNVIIGQTRLPDVEKEFKNIPDSVKLAVYWYWMSDNISKDGVINDLKAMKEAGINRAFIGNIYQADVPAGKVKFLSPEWWDITHTALKTAADLGIEIGIFNSPGWSQSGGPWIKNEESMRYLASSEVEVKGNGKAQVIDIPSPAKDASTVRVIAYPVNKKKGFSRTWSLDKKNGETLTKDLSLDKAKAITTVSITAKSPISTTVSVYAKTGNEYELLKKVLMDRSNTERNVGFDPLAPVVLSIPETKAKDFRIEFDAPGTAALDVTLDEAPKIERYAEKTLSKMFQQPLPMWHDYMWADQPEAVNTSWNIDPTKVVDITDKMISDSQLKWNVPKGKWIIARTAMVNTGVTNSPASPEATGMEVDKMSKKHVSSHFDAYLGEILRRVPAEDRKTFKVVVEDSYETGGQNWTDDMIEVFTSVYGYSPVPYMPALEGKVVGDRDKSDRFLWDLRRLIADRVAYDYVGGLKEISNKHGLTTWLENYGHWGFPGEFLLYGSQSDEIGGEFWSEGSLGDIENRAASSCGHIYGKRKVWAESCTAGGPGFSRYPNKMKQRVDRFFTEGINATLLHLYIQQPYEDKNPGVSAAFGNEFNRKNTWFSQMDVFSDYLKRCNLMLQEGRYVADVAYFIGEDAPKMTGVCDPALPKGYSFDYINADVLKNHARVVDGKLVLDSGVEYSLLVLPKQETMRPELLSKISRMVNDGLVVLGPAPKKSPSLQNYPAADKEVASMAAKLWKGEKVNVVGKGKVYDGVSIETIFEENGVVPDIAQGSNTLFIHRTLPDAEIYFIANPEQKIVDFVPEFRVKGKVPQLWSPQSSEIRTLSDFTQTANGTKVPMRLYPLESVFVVFKDGEAPSVKKRNFPIPTMIRSLESPWKVAFEKGKNGPDEAIVMDKLSDWTESADSRIKYFSGEAVYTTTFDMDNLPEGECYIDLGKVMVMAKVKVNGQYAGGVWTNPYRLNISKYLKKGENTLEVTVVNNWQNRLIGDQNLPESERSTWTSVNPWKADSQLQSSGLLGPVQLRVYEE